MRDSGAVKLVCVMDNISGDMDTYSYKFTMSAIPKKKCELLCK